MSAYTNGLAFWKHFEEKQGAIINCLKAEQYEELNELIQELDEEVMEISGAHFFVESFYDSFEMTFDTGPNKTTQYLCQMLCDVAPKSVKQNWIMNATLPPMSQKAIQAMVQIKNEEYTLADFHVFYQIENDMLDCKVYCPGFNLIGNPENKKEMIVLDRPNPCDYVEGPVLKAGYKSFVGMLPLPVLHGCTIGELAQMINGEGWLGKNCPLTVIPIKGWQHGQPYVLPVKPSPNLPDAQSIRLYASLCPFEATRISVGRGTTFPFQVLGAPDKKYGDFVFTPRSLPGFDKNPMHKGVACYGEDLRNVTDVNGFTLRYLLRFYRLSGEGAAFFSRPRWFDLLMGTDSVRKAILQGKSEKEICDNWQKELQTYQDMRQKYLLY